MEKFKNMLEKPIYLATKVDVTPRNMLIRNVQEKNRKFENMTGALFRNI